MGQFINKLNACIFEAMVPRSVEMSIDKIIFVLVPSESLVCVLRRDLRLLNLNLNSSG